MSFSKEVFHDNPPPQVYGRSLWVSSNLPLQLCSYRRSCIPCWTVCFVRPESWSVLSLMPRPEQTLQKCYLQAQMNEWRPNKRVARASGAILVCGEILKAVLSNTLESGLHLWKSCLLIALYGDTITILWLSLQKYAVSSRQMNR